MSNVFRGLVVVTTTTFSDEPQRLLRDSGFDVRMNPLRRPPSVQESVELMKGAVAVIAGTEKIDGELLRNCPSIRLISRCGVGVDSIDLHAADERHVEVLTAKGDVYRAAAELSVGLMLSVRRRISEADRYMRAGQWAKCLGESVWGSTVGLIGCGNVGSWVARLLVGFSVKVRIFDPFAEFDQGFLDETNATVVELTRLLEECDIVSIHAPGDSGCALGEAELARMKPTAVVINTARGHLINESALYRALVSGRLAGAGLDAFTEEPYSGPLTDLRNVVLTPHMGSYDRSSRLKMEMESAQNLLHWFDTHRTVR